MHLLTTIYWGDVTAEQTYLYGSVIDYYDHIVVFENLTFASGKPIKTWFSRTHYQVSRQSPDLPLLYAGQSYRLEPVMTVTPSARTYFQVTFYNRQKEEIGFAILREGQWDFTYPQDAFTYSITLFNAGCDSLTFSHLSLYAERAVKPRFDLPKTNARQPSQPDVSGDLAFVTSLLLPNVEE